MFYFIAKILEAENMIYKVKVKGFAVTVFSLAARSIQGRLITWI